jgi:hypothetical protein
MTTDVFKFSVVGAVVIVAIVFGAWYFLAPPDEAPAMPGRIEGTTNYPSEYTPEQVVCAQPTEGGESLCTEAPAGYAGESTPTWSIEAPAGSYFVYARLKDPSEMGSDFGEYRAYYTAYVLCTSDTDCPDHSKLPVTVTSGQTVSDIAPHDWYMR